MMAVGPAELNSTRHIKCSQMSKRGQQEAVKGRREKKITCKCWSSAKMRIHSSRIGKYKGTWLVFMIENSELK